MLLYFFVNVNENINSIHVRSILINYNHWMAKDTRVWQKSVIPFCEKSIGHIHVIHIKEYYIFYCYL